ncbi:MAG: peptidylprolyl isomerase [Eggerthellaceae bacterium]|nr:peptidylprolyl isomerase [Eggerthellaceae bacterium]
MNKKLGALVAATALAVMAVLGMSGCSASSEIDVYNTSGGVAAQVNDTKIGEDAVTKYIANLREVQNLQDDEAWAQWLVGYGYTDVSDFREELVQHFVDEEVLLQVGKEKELEIPDEELTKGLESVKERAEQEYADEEDPYQKLLNDWGLFTEGMLKRTLSLSWIQNELVYGDILEVEDPTEEELVEAAGTYGDQFSDMRKSSHILLEDEEEAKKLLSDIKAGTISFEDAAKEHSTDTASAENGGDVGWDKLTSFVEEYQSALSKMNKGDITDPVKSQFGWHIIKCTDMYSLPAEIKSTEGIPKEVVDVIFNAVQSNKTNVAYEELINDFKEKSTIEIKEAPENLAYWVDLTNVELMTPDELVDLGTEEASEGSEESAKEETAAE